LIHIALKLGYSDAELPEVVLLFIDETGGEWWDIAISMQRWPLPHAGCVDSLHTQAQVLPAKIITSFLLLVI